jgi:mannosyl-oligosaccharide alpha-1,2-mannosidase
MALLKRYGLYTVLVASFLYLLYTLSFPYEADANRPHRPKKAQNNNKNNDKPSHKQYNWAKIKLRHPVKEITPLPTGAPKPLPKIQHQFEEEEANAKNIRETRRDEVRKTFLRSWRNYRKKAWMHDELKPVSGGHKDVFGGWAASLIDALDTLWLMGFKEEFESALVDVAKINFGHTNMEKVNVFETNIRHLGGLLSAYELSKEAVLLKKAKEVGEMLYHAFDTPNHMPVTRWDPVRCGEGKAQQADETVLVAELGSLTMEFTRLSQLTGNSKWYDAITRVTKVFSAAQDKTKLPGMWPIVVNARKPDLTGDTGFSIGAMADSTYEYFAKTYILLGGQEPVYKKLYEKSMEAAIQHTFFRPMTPGNADMLMTGFVRAEETRNTLNPEMQHLACYAGGMFALGGKIFNKPAHVTIGRKLTDTCVWAYKVSPAGIMPEISHLYPCPSKANCTWSEEAWKMEIDRQSTKEKDPQQNIANLRLPEGFTAIDDRRYMLRPEAIESVFLLYRITGGQQWQAAAWDMFTAIEKHTATELGNAALLDVSSDNPPKSDSMEVSDSLIQRGNEEGELMN